MAERYWITGVQLGLLRIMIENNFEKKDVDKLINQIIEEQFIGRFESSADKKRFDEYIEKIKSKGEKNNNVNYDF